MAKVWTAIIEAGKPKMSPYTQADFNDWCKENPGQQIRIEVAKKPVSQEMRGYYFSAVIPVIRSTCDEWKNLSQAEMHDVIKKMFFYFETWNPKTERMERFGRSVMGDSEWNNSAKAMQFLQILEGYLADCGLEMPDSAEYKAIRDGRDDKVEDIEYPEGPAVAIPF